MNHQCFLGPDRVARALKEGNLICHKTEPELNFRSRILKFRLPLQKPRSFEALVGYIVINFHHIPHQFHHKKYLKLWLKDSLQGDCCHICCRLCCTANPFLGKNASWQWMERHVWYDHHNINCKYSPNYNLLFDLD